MDGSQYTRDPDLWFDDGNIMLQVAPRLFRVHRSILAMNSDVLKDMMAAHLSTKVDLLDSLPLIVLQGDDAGDAIHFLKALYIPQYFAPPPISTKLDVLEGILRFAHKYRAPVLRRSALLHLAIAYPTEVSDLKEYAHQPHTYTVHPEDALQEYMVVATLARDAHAPWVLPSLFYRISMRFCSKARFLETLPWLGRQRWLAHDDVAACIAGYAELRKEFPHAVFFDDALGCQDAACTLTCAKLCTQEDMEGFVVEPLTYFTLWLQDDRSFRREAICSRCIKAMRAEYGRWLASVWDRLPAMFNLPGWAELREIKNRDLGVRVLPFWRGSSMTVVDAGRDQRAGQFW
ncbi:hypothetical protein HDZ31DRAFT_47036 [Schizophyllum fasciatum]